MKEYHLERINANIRALSIILIMPLLFGILVVVHLWDDYPFYGKLGLALVVVSLLGMIISYLNIRKSDVLKIDNDTLIITNKKGTKERRVNIKDIALIQYDKSINAIEVFITKNPILETIILFSNTGKAIFVGSNHAGSIEFNRFFADIRSRINAKEKFVFAKRIKMTKVYRSLFINPLHEDSSSTKKKKRQAGFWYPMIIFMSGIIIFITAFQLLGIYGISFNPSAPRNFSYKDVSFQREYYWDIKTDEKEYYYIDCESKAHASTIAIAVIKGTDGESPQEYVEYYLEDMEEAEPECKIGKIETGKFGIYDCVKANYSYDVEGITFYATICAFNANDKSISIVMQSDRDTGLWHDFKLIEETFKVK